tara:strand:- start:414 stop:968 length:555 start_codon:yes stop_codon:yes gene_type:complete
MQQIEFEKVEQFISHIYKSDYVDEIDSYIQGLQHELKRDELFVSEVFNSLDELDNENFIDIYREVLNYLDGAMYIINAYKATGETNPNDFVDLIKRGWTNKDYDDFVAFRSLEYRDPVICETTDLYTEIENFATLEGFDVVKYLTNGYEGNIEQYCVETLQAYYCDNIEANIKELKDPSWSLLL